MISLRPHQREQVEAVIRGLWLGSDESTLIEACTGSGKTTSFAEVARRALDDCSATRVLVLAHRRELLDQAAARLDLFGLTVARRVRNAHRAQVTVASVSSLRRAIARGEVPADLFDLVIVDEAHHAPARGYRFVLDFLTGKIAADGGLLNPIGIPIGNTNRTRVLGVTATPDRADGIGLGSVFASVAHRYGIERAIADGHLVPVHGLSVEVPGMDLSKVRLRRQKASGGAPVHEDTRDLLAPGGQAYVEASSGERHSVDLHPGDLSRAALAPEAVSGVVEPLLRLAGDRPTCLFAVDRRHARALTAEINARTRGRLGLDEGGRLVESARYVDGSMRAAERRRVLEDFAAGRFQYLVSVALLLEGWDCPRVACVAMARPTQSRIIYAQACGRGLRLSPETGKRDLLVLDFVGASCEHALVGPEDVLGGALEGPVRTFKKRPKNEAGWYPIVKPAPPPSEESAPVAPPLAAREVEYAAREVDVVRGAGASSPARAPRGVRVPGAVVSASRAVEKAVTYPAGLVSRAVGWLARVAAGMPRGAK